MKNTVPSLFSILLAAFVSLSVSCKKGDSDTGSGFGGKGSGSDSDSGGQTYPRDTTLTSKEGKTIEVTLTGRTEKEVFFMNKADGRDYTLEYDRLSPKDKLKMKKMPLHRPPDPKKLAAQRQHTEKLARYISFREGELERLRRQLGDKENEELAFENGPTSKKRQIKRDIESLEHSIRKLEEEIKAAQDGGDI